MVRSATSTRPAGEASRSTAPLKVAATGSAHARAELSRTTSPNRLTLLLLLLLANAAVSSVTPGGSPNWVGRPFLPPAQKAQRYRPASDSGEPGEWEELPPLPPPPPLVPPPPPADVLGAATLEAGAVDLIASHLLTHHREGFIRCINAFISSDWLIESINGAAGDLVTIQAMSFNVTGPLAPERYFHCSDVRLSRGRRSDLLHADLAVEYTNRLSLAVDLLRLPSAFRVINPLGTPMRVVVWGRAEGATRLRLTVQADPRSYLRLAHVTVTDASALRVRLDSYGIDGAGLGIGRALSFVTGQLPLRRLEGVLNDCLQYCFDAYRDGWPVCGGVLPPDRLGRGG